jgi:hypothetical protein
VAALEQAGVRCWVAPRDILAGEEWAAAILRGISGARVMVLIFSNDANVSEHVRREVERAVNRGLTILPLRIEEVMPSGAMEYFLSSRHWLDAMSPPFEAHLKRLCETVAPLVGRQERAPEVKIGPQPPPAQKSARKRVPIALVVLGVLIGLAVLVGAGWGWKLLQKPDAHIAQESKAVPSATPVMPTPPVASPRNEIETAATQVALSPPETRKARIEALMTEARQNDTPAQGHRALVALDHLLALDPYDVDAIALRRKIVGYYGSSELAPLLKEAADIANNDSSVDDRLGYLGAISQLQAQAGDLAGARRNLGAFAQGHEREQVYIAVLRGQCRAGDLAGAAATRSEMGSQPNSDAYSQASSWIALTQIQNGDLDGAIERANSQIPDVQLQSQVMGLVVKAQARRGDITAAQKTIEKMPAANPTMPAQEGARGWAFLALAQMEMGDFAAATRSAQKVPDGRLKDQMIAQMSYERVLFLARTRQFGAANDAAESLTPDDRRIDALCEIGLIQRAYGDTDGSKQSYLRAEALVPTSDARRRACLLADAGDREAALLAMDGLNDYVARAEVCREIAYAQAKSGEWREAEQWARSREAPMDKLLAIVGAVEGVAGR